MVSEMLTELGFPDAVVASELQPLPGAPKQARLTFTIDDGPQTRLRRIEFEGNASFTDSRWRGR